jgi:hypothetical protein
VDVCFCLVLACSPVLTVLFSSACLGFCAHSPVLFSPESLFDKDSDFGQKVDLTVRIREILQVCHAVVLGAVLLLSRAYLSAGGCVPFGQSRRDMCTMMGMQAYADGISIVKELIQNADDARAHTVRFCWDQRQLGTATVMDPKMAQFQGPALLIYNSGVFTEGWLVSDGVCMCTGCVH